MAVIALSLLSCRQNRIDNYYILLQDGWKFRQGDDLSRAAPDCNDASWDSIPVGKLSEPAVFEKYDGYGWYRTKVFISAAIKTMPHLKDSLIFFLGKIDDCDQVYLNGKLLGQNTQIASPGSSPDPHFTDKGGLWQKDRKYIVPITDSRIKWDQINTIAIRVFDQSGGGGQYGKIPYIGMMDLNEYIVIDMSRFYTIDGKDSLEKRFCIKNIAPGIAYSGTLSVNAKDRETGKDLFDWETPLRLSAGDSALIPITFPVSTDSLNVVVRFQDAGGRLTAIDSVTIPYALALQSRQPL